MDRVLLSASFPEGARARSFEPYDGAQIADACVHLARAVLRRGGRLVFGAHPTISPLVLAVAGELGLARKVEIFQSAWFQDVIPAETRRLLDHNLGDIEWTPKHASRAASVAAMRERMLDSHLAAAVFIGGMEGILDEFELAAKRRVRCFAFTAPGGASRRLDRAGDRVVVLHGTQYPELAARITDAIGLRASATDRSDL